MDPRLDFHQLFDPESSTYTYLLFDKESHEGILIDPVLEQASRDLDLLRKLQVKLLYTFETHVHADHITGASEIRRQTGAKIGISKFANVTCADLLLEDGDEISFGKFHLKVIHTPGHTDCCTCYFIEGRIFTGDTLLIGVVGRTDFQQGSPERLYDCLTQKLFTLPPETLVYPGHDYKGEKFSTIAREMKENQRIGGNKTKDEFVKIMSSLNLPKPKKIEQAVPANMKCGDLSS